MEVLFLRVITVRTVLEFIPQFDNKTNVIIGGTNVNKPNKSLRLLEMSRFCTVRMVLFHKFQHTGWIAYLLGTSFIFSFTTVNLQNGESFGKERYLRKPSLQQLKVE